MATSSDHSLKTFRERLKLALWRRLNSGSITRKHLQHALGVSAGTVDNLLSGNNDPSARVLLALITVFDATFANELLDGTGATLVKLSDKRAIDAARMIAEGAAILKAMEGGKCG